MRIDRDPDDDNTDAYDADEIVQVAVFGKVIYA